jgi:hypothetical protein
MLFDIFGITDVREIEKLLIDIINWCLIKEQNDK